MRLPAAAPSAGPNSTCDEHRPRFSVSPQLHQQLLTGYAQAVQTGDMTALTDVLAEDVVLWADGGGKIKQAALRPIRGRDAVARFSLGTRRFWPENARAELEEVNGQASLIVRTGEETFAVLTVEVEDDTFKRFGLLPTRINSRGSNGG